MRGGLVWLDSECRQRFDKAFVDCTDAERRQVARRRRVARAARGPR